MDIPYGQIARTPAANRGIHHGPRQDCFGASGSAFIEASHGNGAFNPNRIGHPVTRGIHNVLQMHDHGKKRPTGPGSACSSQAATGA
jgi:hypothetical protein